MRFGIVKIQEIMNDLRVYGTPIYISRTQIPSANGFVV